ncbi:hypothetical protein ES288_D08G082200v1 [Gossypium darwinii]|uniref:Transcription repressor n=1 Tax=Gossypium darwinii TaxID=34276 RepID=A0A5D2BHR5_GOSDA|nr:hypothetical protein ES288_D08G082200v1 [Gossypium darwinii]
MPTWIIYINGVSLFFSRLKQIIMPTSVGKNINLCFIKVKFPLTSSSLLTASDNGLPLPSSAATPSSLLFSPSNSLSTHSSSHPNPELESHSEPDFATTQGRPLKTEMVEARGLMDVKANWDNLHELLLCYLALNPKSTHKYIVGAFADLVVSLMANASTPQRRRH